MKTYRHIFFDLDQTLWDFDRCSAETITELFKKYSLSSFVSCDCEDVVQKFNEVNELLWGQFSSGKITKDELRNTRFKMVFKPFGSLEEDLLTSFADDYLANCPRKGHLIPYAEEILNYLHGKYELHIITNGFEEVQHHKLYHSGISKYFTEVITSDSIGYKKPEKEIFNYALKRVNCQSSNCLMIGDSLEADMLGASNSGIDHVFYNPKSARYFLNVTYEIKCLTELREIL